MFQSPTLTGSLMGLGVTLAFSGLLLALTRFLPGRTHLGAPLPDGTRVAYPMNGAPTFFISVVAYVGLGAAGVFDPVWPIRHFFDLLIGANLFAVILTAILWWQGPERHQQSAIMGFWLGAELNPRWFDVDLKVFSYRPSLIGLELLVIAFGFAELQQNGSISLAMWLFQAFWLFYLAMTFLFEHGMLSMFDVIEERFGFMLVFGDYGLVPFFYCIGGFAILTRPEPLSIGAAVAIALLFSFGYWIFRGANGHARRDTRRNARRTRLTRGGRRRHRHRKRPGRSDSTQSNQAPARRWMAHKCNPCHRMDHRLVPCARRGNGKGGGGSSPSLSAMRPSLPRSSHSTRFAHPLYYKHVSPATRSSNACMQYAFHPWSKCARHSAVVTKTCSIRVRSSTRPGHAGCVSFRAVA